MQEQATSSLPSSSERSSSSAAHQMKEADTILVCSESTRMQDFLLPQFVACVLKSRCCSSDFGCLKKKLGVGAESDDEIRRVPDFGGELLAGPSTSGREVSSAGVGDRIQAASAEAGQQRKRGRDPADKEHKRLKRLLRNRVSAQQARERKKAYLSDLEGKVKELEKRNSELEERLSTLQNENQMLRQILKNTTVSRRGSASSANGEGSV
ncbi:hypothetical protein Taro_029059 [Colocasia esculenta]|uniref:Transcription factor HY5 n=1 Tax=Colocasia esculenta TaxID=4460 RepID=A0A843VI08_COLES|nr:hypothetical protein [Colocasia esculenta]